ncbi:estradiol 17 beta-dehydrogenase 8-like [Saccoglossus kowalevskii]|uniref:Estradiol 17 beta-dehydrogenase 8-like n=1 Tax=Saccoglossus kowalevskii TaxID=10224 RepID=A0ABM0GGW8_SACKO|nr:estradiol 17 beta-dehydrogenase 8-like [Saccoglossus kowalevskii]
MAASLQLNKLFAVVTGGGSGIGRAVCHRFAKEGASVAVVDINSDHAQSTANDLAVTHDECKHAAFTADVSSTWSVKQLTENLLRSYKNTPTILVHSAGITKDSFMVKMDEKSFDDVISVNLKGTFLVTQAITKLMIDNKIKHGSIITMASISGRVGNLGQCNYSASKAGVEGFTKTIAKELARHDIRCNTVVPGWIQTPMTEAVPEKVMTKHLGMVPLGRLGQPEDVADVCLFLASEKSSYITGASIEVTGGLFM